MPKQSLASLTPTDLSARHICILGVGIDAVDFSATLKQLALWINAPAADRSDTHQICTVNPEFIIDARRDPAFARVLQEADLCVPDGVGVLWAARSMDHPLPERVTGSDGIYRICKRAAAEGWRVYLLGAAPGVAAKTAAALINLYDGLQIVGTHSGSPADEEWPQIHARLNEAQPDILFVAFGHPNQDLWIAQHRAELPAAVAIGVGAAFDFVAGVSQRAPVWMQRIGLEWFYRLIREPWRIKRMRKLPIFAILVILQWGLHKFAPPVNKQR